MDPVAFRRQQAPRWAETLALVERAERTRFRGLDKAELDALALGYRRLASDLAVAQREFPSSDVTFELNRLVARAHGIVYRRRGTRPAELWRFLAAEVPRTIRRRQGYLVVAALLFVVPTVAAYTIGRLDPPLASAYVPESMVVAAQGGGLHTDEILSVMPSSLLSSHIMTNNIGVIFTAFALGITLGLGSMYILIFNGLMLGTVVAFYSNHGLADRLFAFLLPHGVIELSAICVSGAAGLLVGDALVSPGARTRAQALREQGRDAVRIVLGLVPVLVVAGLVEGFISPSEGYAPETKAAIGIALGVAMWTWIHRGGRASGQPSVPE